MISCYMFHFIYAVCISWSVIELFLSCLLLNGIIVSTKPFDVLCEMAQIDGLIAAEVNVFIIL